MTLVRALAGVNVALELDRFDLEIERVAHMRYVRPEYLSLATPSSERQIEGSFFARAGVLVAIKSLVMASGQPQQPAAFEPFVVGDLSLDANEIAFANPTKLPSDLDDFDLVVTFLPFWDLYNPRFLGYSLARAYRMIELLGGDDPTVVKLRSRLSTGPDLEFDGLQWPTDCFAQAGQSST